MFVSSFTSPFRAARNQLRAIGTAMSVRFGTPGPAHRGPHMRDIRDLDDHMLKDIGYARQDTMDAHSRKMMNRLMMTAIY